MKTKTKNTKMFVMAVMIAMSFNSLWAANYDLRFHVDNYDCENMKLFVDIEIKASSSSPAFHLASQNYRFTFNDAALNNPSKHSELAISGVKIGAGYNAFYMSHTLTGSTGNTVSYNVQLSSGNGYIIEQNWVPVGRLAFDVLDINEPFNLNWISGAGAYPSTIIATTSGSVSPGALSNLSAHQSELNIRLFLEGAYEPTKNEMSTYLNLLPGSNLHRGMLPGQAPLSPTAAMTTAGQPYAGIPWQHPGLAGANMHQYETSVVDWVLVVLRSGMPGGQADVWSGAGLLHKDGTVELMSSPNFAMIPSNVYVVVIHRNHLPIMTAAPISNDPCGTISYDFTTQDSYHTATTFGQKEMASGVFAMYAGNSEVTSDAPYFGINGMDKILWTSDNGYYDTYLITDFNLDSEVNALDKLLWYDNNGINSAIRQ